VKFTGNVWTVEIWTVKTGLGLPLGLGFLLELDLGLGLVLGFELVFRLGLGLRLVLTVQFMTVQILDSQNLDSHKLDRQVTTERLAAPTFWPMSIVVKRLDGSRRHSIWKYIRLGPDHIVLDGNPAPRKGHDSPLNFGWCLLWPSGWMDPNTTWYGGRPQRMRHCVR